MFNKNLIPTSFVGKFKYFSQMLDQYSRFQKGLVLDTLYPKILGVCACGCKKPLTGRKTKWATTECNERAYRNFAIVKGDTEVIRNEVFIRDEGFCYDCGVFDENWQADHIVPVKLGGGGCGLENFQTLCPSCHLEKTKNQILSQRSEISSHAAETLFKLAL